jgi:hypothetical protein
MLSSMLFPIRILRWIAGVEGPPLSRLSDATGVGNHPNSVTSVGCVDGTSRNNHRPRGEAESVQVRKHLVEAHADDPSNILSKNPSGPEFFDKTAHFRPEVTVIFRASSLPGNTKRLAGVSSANKVNWANIFASQCSYIFKLPDIRPMLCQDLPAKRINFAERDGGHPSPLQAKAESTDTAEQVEDFHDFSDISQTKTAAISVYTRASDTGMMSLTSHL